MQKKNKNLPKANATLIFGADKYYHYRSGIANLETWFFSAMFYFQILANLI